MNALEIKNLTKTFPGFTLDNLNLTLPSGCVMGLIGENGAGKSTTIRLILDMLHSDSGTVTILGRDNRENIRLTKEEVGVVLDEVGLPGIAHQNDLSRRQPLGLGQFVLPQQRLQRHAVLLRDLIKGVALPHHMDRHLSYHLSFL